MAKHTGKVAPNHAAKQRKRRRWITGIAAGGAAAVLIVGYVICCALVDQDTVLGHVTINGVDLQGMTRAEVQDALEAKREVDYAGTILNVEAEGSVYEVRVGNAFVVDTEQGVELAFARGHGSFLTRGAALVRSLFTEDSWELAPQADDLDALRAAVEASGLMEINTAVKTSYKITETALVFAKGAAGVSVDEEALIPLLEEAANQGDYSVVIQCPMLPGTLEPVDLQAIYDELYVAPKNATLDPEQDYAVVESVTGVSFDVEAAQTLLDTSAEGSTVEVPLVYTEPDITTSLLEKNLFRDVLGTYTTSVSGTSNRKNNVKLAAQKCNGVIIMPGETFSYNGTVGQRTTAAGYREAGAYVNGEVVQSVGGGICQVSSTLYNAALLANLEITERHNHTYASSYVPLGLDATVSWGGPDFKFTNNTDYPIKITTSYSSSNKLTCKIYGTDLSGYTVKMTSETLSVTPYNVVKKKTSSLYVGESSVKTSGENGYKVQTYRKVYDSNGTLISSEKEAYSVYKKMDEVRLVGTKEKPQKTTGSTGNEGSTGDAGNTGNEGSTGESGNTGNEGNTGAAGGAESSGGNDENQPQEGSDSPAESSPGEETEPDDSSQEPAA